MSSDWQEISLIKALDVNPAVKMQKGDVYPFVDMQSIEAGNKYVMAHQEREFKSSGSRFIDGDTLMARITPCLENGKISRYRSVDGNPAHGSTEFIVLRHRKGITHPEFVYYLTISDQVKPYAIAQMTGSSGRQRVPVNSFKHLTINLPPLPEQQAISEILKTLDDKIELNRQMCDTLEKTASALFRSWFVDFDPVKAKIDGRVPEGIEPELLDLFPDSFKDSDLGPIPAGWEVKAMDEIADFLNGLALQKYPAVEGQPHLPVIKIAEINRGITQQTSKASADIPAKYIIDDGDVLFSWSGSLTAILWPYGKGALNQHLFKVTSSKYPKWFYYQWIWQHLPFYRMIAASKATTMGHIKRQHLSETKAYIPSDPLLKEADKIFAPMLSRIVDLGTEIRCLSNMRDNLLPKLISGELRVEDVGGV